MQRALVLKDLPPPPAQVVITDPDDAFLFSMAVSGKADFLITGDRRAGLLQLGHAGRAHIVTPAAFCKACL